MKNLILLFALASLPGFGFGQLFVGDVDIAKDKSIKFIEVFVTQDAQTGANTKLARVNYGAEVARNKDIIMEGDSIKEFEGLAGVLNHLDSNGFEFLYHQHISGRRNMQNPALWSIEAYFVMRRKE